MFCPALTGSGESVFVTARSERVCTAVVAVPVLLVLSGSVVVLDATALFVTTKAFAALALTLTTNVNAAFAPAANVGLVDVTVPVPPTAGVELTHAGDENETNVVFAGMISVNETD